MVREAGDEALGECECGRVILRILAGFECQHVEIRIVTGDGEGPPGGLGGIRVGASLAVLHRQQLREFGMIRPHCALKSLGCASAVRCRSAEPVRAVVASNRRSRD